MIQAKTVDEYISLAPKNIQGSLKQLRSIIRKLAPGASEKMSYGMPYYGYKGKLVYFSFTKTHIGLYIPPPVIENHREELKNYSTAKATIRFPLDKKLPIALIKKLIKVRMIRNEK